MTGTPCAYRDHMRTLARIAANLIFIGGLILLQGDGWHLLVGTFCTILGLDYIIDLQVSRPANVRVL